MRFFKRPEVDTTPHEIADAWELSEGEYDGRRLITRFNEGAKVVMGRPGYSIQIGVAVPFTAPTEEGMPSDVDMEALEAFEEVVIDRAASRAVLVGIITTGGMREYVLYTGSGDWIEGFHHELQAALPSHDVQVMAQQDPKWSVYRQFVDA
jgi:hypothetical protein